MNVVLVSLAIVMGLLLVLEVGLRLLFGFGNPLLYLADEEIGYLLAPNQRTRRFGNRITINQYSMRSPMVTKTRDTTTLRTLLLGDSVANGAWWTDQDQTISALITTQLERVVPKSSHERLILQTPFECVEVLNASANSWGPQNVLAYLKRFGTFEAQAVVVLLNTDDLFATAPTSEPVGHDRHYPNRKPACALAEVFDRYLLPKLSELRRKAITKKMGGGRDEEIGGISTKEAPPLERVVLEQPKTAVFEEEMSKFNLDAIRQTQRLVAGAGAKFVLAMTPLLREIGEPGPRDYELKARERLNKLTQDEQISYLDFLPIFNRMEAPQRLYRDHIHLSPLGNQTVSEAIARSLQQLLHLPATAANE